MANHHVIVDGANSVHIHSHLYHIDTHYCTLRINNNLTGTSSSIVIIRHNLITSLQSNTD